MNMIYNSPNYCIVEYVDFDDAADRHPAGGFEIVDKTLWRGFFLEGEAAMSFRENVAQMREDDVSIEEVDEFLTSYAGLLTRPVVQH